MSSYNYLKFKKPLISTFLCLKIFKNVDFIKENHKVLFPINNKKTIFPNFIELKK